MTPSPEPLPEINEPITTVPSLQPTTEVTDPSKSPQTEKIHRRIELDVSVSRSWYGEQLEFPENDPTRSWCMFGSCSPVNNDLEDKEATLCQRIYVKGPEDGPKGNPEGLSPEEKSHQGYIHRSPYKDPGFRYIAICELCRERMLTLSSQGDFQEIVLDAKDETFPLPLDPLSTVVVRRLTR